MVLALSEPERSVVLVEPREKREVFLKEVKRELELENMAVLRTRMEELKVVELEPVGLSITRALGDIESYLRAVAPVLSPSSFVTAMLGPTWELSEKLKSPTPQLSFSKLYPYSLSQMALNGS